MNYRDTVLPRINGPRLLVYAGLASLTLFMLSCSDDGPTQPAYEFADLEYRIFQLVNLHRDTVSLGALDMSDVITEQARNHSKNMAAGAVPFGHDGFETRVSVISQKIRLSKAGENVVAGTGLSNSGETAVKLWLNSPGHRANIEGDFNLTGVGAAKSASGSLFITQIFVKSQ